jgi:hypothetical protein
VGARLSLRDWHTKDNRNETPVIARSDDICSRRGGIRQACAQSNGKPNILIIWGDDIGYWNISAYNQGMMGATGKCWNTRGRVTALASPCSCSTTTRRANTPMAPPRGGQQGRHVHPGAVRRGDEGWLDRHQHEEGLEAHLCVCGVTTRTLG